MKREIMEAAGLASWVEVGLIIFIVVFVAIAVRVFFMSREAARAAAQIPLEDEPTSAQGRSDT